MAKQTIEIDVPVGFKATGEYRRPRNGEWFLLNSGTPKKYTTQEWYEFYPILEKIEVTDTYWLAKDNSGLVYAYFIEQPKFNGFEWRTDGLSNRRHDLDDQFADVPAKYSLVKMTATSGEVQDGC